jgi:hypothetical protein
LGSSGLCRQLNQKAPKNSEGYSFTAMASKHTTIFHGELAQRCGKGSLVRSYRRNVEKTKFYSLHKLCYTTCTSINILTSKGGEVLMATKKAAAKKPVKKAAKKK